MPPQTEPTGKLPNLDDRRFQDIVNEARKLIPRYCPEWTDHNVSDPGIALIELFAWMTDMLLYRVNQVPDKMYRTFLDLIGMRLEPPHAAEAPITFYFSSAQPNNVTIPVGTQVATLRTETEPAIIFSTVENLVVRSVTVSGAFVSQQVDDRRTYTEQDLRRLQYGEPIDVFPESLVPGDAFYLALEHDHSNHLLVLTVDCIPAGGRGIRPEQPPIEWQVRSGERARWINCELESDSTGGFNLPSGEIWLHLPTDLRSEELPGSNKEAFWLRCRLSDRQAGEGGYQKSPQITGLRVEARGGTVRARNAMAVRNEVLGRSDGTPGQQFTVQYRPVLEPTEYKSGHEQLVVELADGTPQTWQEVEDFSNSTHATQYYMFDRLEGTVTFGPQLLQPDGRVKLFGAVPPKDSLLRISYQHGGGVIGNVRPGSLNVLKSALPYVNRVTNRDWAAGGKDAQSLDDARLRAPDALRTRRRAVLAEDYQFHAESVRGVERVCVIAPGNQQAPAVPGSDLPPPGEVWVVVLPTRAANDEYGFPLPPQTWPSELQKRIEDYMAGRVLVGTIAKVRPVQYLYISVQVALQLHANIDWAAADTIQRHAEEMLYRYLNAYIGGSDGKGWPFGRELYRSEIYSLLHEIEPVQFVHDDLEVRSSKDPTTPGTVYQSRIDIPTDTVICSGKHSVTVQVT